MRRYFPFLIVLPLLLLYVGFLLWLYPRHPDSASDFNIYYRGATRLLQGEPLYENLASNDYVGPSFLVQLIAPLVALTDYSTARTIWMLLSFAASVAATALIATLLPTRAAQIGLWVLSLLLFPTFLALWMGQVAVILFFLLIAAWWAYRSGQRAWCGMLLGIAIWTKFFPALIVVYFLWKREGRVVLWAVIASIAAVVFQIAGTGFDTFVDYYTRVLPQLASEGQPEFAWANHSVLGFAQKTFILTPNSVPLVESDFLVQITRWSLTLGMLGALFFLTFKLMRQTSTQRFDVEYALVLCTALLLGSTLGYYGIQAALLAYAILWRQSRNHLYISLWFVVSLLMINFNLMLTLGDIRMGGSTSGLPWYVLSTPFLSFMLLWVWLARLQRREQQNVI